MYKEVGIFLSAGLFGSSLTLVLPSFLVVISFIVPLLALTTYDVVKNDS